MKTGPTQAQEYENEMAQAVAIYGDADVVSVKMELVTDETALAAGKEAYTKNCVACHKADGGGSVGPNLTDNKWVLGGGVKNIFNTISKGGRPGKGMIAWESTISRDERIQLASYIISMQGTTPAAPKASEGDITWPE